MNSLIYGGIYTMSDIEDKVYILLKEESNIVYLIELNVNDRHCQNIKKELRTILNDVETKDSLSDNILKANKIDFLEKYDGYLGKAI